MKKILKKVVVWHSITSGGDGSVYIEWFLTQKEAQEAQSNDSEPWGEDCSGSVETFEGSDIHKKASEPKPKW
jgi:hypothetical protein